MVSVCRGEREVKAGADRKEGVGETVTRGNSANTHALNWGLGLDTGIFGFFGSWLDVFKEPFPPQP